jgi:hypothetical protein
MKKRKGKKKTDYKRIFEATYFQLLAATLNFSKKMQILIMN